MLRMRYLNLIADVATCIRNQHQRLQIEEKKNQQEKEEEVRSYMQILILSVSISPKQGFFKNVSFLMRNMNIINTPYNGEHTALHSAHHQGEATCRA